MPDRSALTNLAPYHVLIYGTLFGSEVFQSFVGGIVAFRSLPRAQFSSLQKAIFPVYFSMQTALPIALALTFPGQRNSTGIGLSSLSGVLQVENRSHVALPLLVVAATGLANLAVVGPATTRVMQERKHQETRDGKKSYDAGPHSKEMMKLNRSFGKLHGASTVINLVGLVATIWYGVVLAGRIQ